MTRFGLFVRLDETGADGLVPVVSLGDEYFTHDDRAHALVGERSGQRCTLGRTVEVKLKEATPITGGLLFEMLSRRRSPATPTPRLRASACADAVPAAAATARPSAAPAVPAVPNRPSGGRPSGGLKGVRKGKRR